MNTAHNQLKQKTARLSVFSNTILVLLKLFVGMQTGAVSIVSEAAHSAVDLLAAVVAFYAVRKSSKPPDEQHAYGYGKIENLSAAFEALLIIVAAVWIVYEALEKLGKENHPEFLEYGILIMLFSMAVNYWVAGKLDKTASLTGSQALAADALHLRADIWTSAGVLAGLVAMKITGYYWLDPLMAFVVATVVFRAGIRMTKDSMDELTDASWPEEEEEIIREIVRAHPDTISAHNLRTRRSGSRRLVDMHITMKKDMTLEEAHAVCDELEASIKNRFKPCDVVIHLEPCNYHGDCTTCPLVAAELDCPVDGGEENSSKS